MKLNHILGDIFKQKNVISDEDFLKSVILFKDLNFIELKRLSLYLHHREFQDKEIVFQKNEPGESLYVIKSGSVLIKDSLSKDEIVISEGAFFGELSLVDENPRVLSAVANETCELLVLFRSDLQNIKELYPKLAVKLFYNLSFVLGKRLNNMYSSL